MIQIPDSVKSGLSTDVLMALNILGDDISDITAAVDSDTRLFIGLGHIIDGKFEQYNFADTTKKYAIDTLENCYRAEFVHFQNMMTKYDRLWITGKMIFGLIDD